MPLPHSVTRVDRTGNVTFTSSVDRVNYTINELCRAALRDCAKMLRKKMVIKFKKLTGMGKHKRVYSSTQYWVRKKEADLQIGIKHDTWYGVNQELGTKKMPKKGIVRDTVFDNISEIRKIQAKYLSAIENEQTALRYIDEVEAVSGNNEND